MDTASIATIVVGSALLYSTLAGVSWQLAGAHWEDPAPFFAGLLWPLVLPAILGTRLTQRIAARLTTRSGQLPKAQVRQ